MELTREVSIESARCSVTVRPVVGLVNQPAAVQTGSRLVGRRASGVLNRRTAKLFAWVGYRPRHRGFVRVCTLAELRVCSTGRTPNCWRP